MPHRRSIVTCCSALVLAAACGSSSSPTPAPGSSTPPAPGESSKAAPVADAAPADPTPADPAPVDAAPVLRVISLEPANGDVEGGTYVLIKGEHFMKAGPRSVKVYFGSRQGAVVRFQSDRELVVQAPGGKPNEVVDVLVVFDPGGQMKLEKAFTFIEKS